MKRLAVIHCAMGIPWHGPFADKMCAGLARIGFHPIVTSLPTRQPEGIAVLLGTSLWREVERTGPYLLVDRCSFGDTNHYVSLVWNGHGRRGDHKVPVHYHGARWDQHSVCLAPARSGARTVLCGQTETYSPDWPELEPWYTSHPEATHFRPHPAGEAWGRLPVLENWHDVGEAVTLNSSVAIEALIQGVHARVDDEGGMAHGWQNYGGRQEFFEWLSWTQWHHKEIQEGMPIRHLFYD